jgi:hypothetical protein
MFAYKSQISLCHDPYKTKWTLTALKTWNFALQKWIYRECLKYHLTFDGGQGNRHMKGLLRHAV